MKNLNGLATPRRKLVDAESECTVHITLSEPVFVWDMDRQEIKQATTSSCCDFAALQERNPNDEKSYLILIECKRRIHSDDIDHICKQMEGGLEVLRHLAGGKKNFPFKFLQPVWVTLDYYLGAIPDEILHISPVKYHDGHKERRAHIRPAASGILVNDNYVAVRRRNR